MPVSGIICVGLGIIFLIASRFIPSRRFKIRLMIGGPILIICGILILTGVIEPRTSLF